MSADNLIWYKDIPGFVTDTSHFLDFIPDRSMSLVEQLNAIMRFALYLVIILFVIKHDVRCIYILLFAAVITWLISMQDGVEQKAKAELLEKMTLVPDIKGRPCVKPTKDNPFMNVTFADYTEFPNRPKACDISNKKVDDQVTKMFETDFVRATDDIYNRSGSDRQFYSTPSSTIPNDQEAFKKFVYKIPKTAKEDGLTNYFTPIKK